MSSEQPTASASDALTIARWCWPEREWKLVESQAYPRPYAVGTIESVRCASCGMPDMSYSMTLNPSQQADVTMAELELIERGHGRAYSAVLLDHLDIGIQAWCCDHADTIATAPLDARVRAMAAVIRALPKERTTR